MYIRKTLIAGAALALLGATVVVSVPASAASGVGRGLTSSVAGDYNYGSLADFSRSVEGTPCGVNCTRAEATHRDVWGHWGAYYGPMVH
jgi:hypothetical protein